MIQIQQLVKRYGDQTVLELPDLEIPKGQIFGLVGNNGAGKTTLFSLLLDLIQATEGTVAINNIPVHQSEAWKPVTAAFLDESFLIGYLTPEEYFYFIGDLRGVSKSEVDLLMEGFSDFFGGEILNQKKYIRDLSKGNQKKVGIVATFIGNPEILVLDEPFANLDPTTQIRLKELLKEKSQDQGRTVLISSHDLQHVTEVCERIAVLEKGHLVQDIVKTPQTLKELEAFFSKQI
jgi:ABC-2 type transport system ATP-binding protein